MKYVNSIPLAVVATMALASLLVITNPSYRAYNEHLKQEHFDRMHAFAEDGDKTNSAVIAYLKTLDDKASDRVQQDALIHVRIALLDEFHAANWISFLNHDATLNKAVAKYQELEYNFVEAQIMGNKIKIAPFVASYIAMARAEQSILDLK